MDSKLVELIGRNWLTAELLRAGLEVATPARDRGIDLIAYADLGVAVDRFTARPIQLKAAGDRSFSIDRRYGRFPSLLLAYVWDLNDFPSTRCYLMSHEESIAIGDVMGWTKTASWTKGYYVSNSPSKKLLDHLSPYLATRDTWWARIVGHPSKAQ
jgi:hypothetical protein